MDKDTKFALLVVGIPLLGVAYCAFMLAVMFLSPGAILQRSDNFCP